MLWPSSFWGLGVKGNKDDLFASEQRWRKRRMFTPARSRPRWGLWFLLLASVLVGFGALAGWSPVVDVWVQLKTMATSF